MNWRERNDRVKRMLESCLEELESKSPDYSGPSGRAFEEVEETARILGVEPEQVLAVHFRKHLSAMWRVLRGDPLHSETFESRCRDAINYIGLIYVYVVAVKNDEGTVKNDEDIPHDWIGDGSEVHRD